MHRQTGPAPLNGRGSSARVAMRSVSGPSAPSRDAKVVDRLEAAADRDVADRPADDPDESRNGLTPVAAKYAGREVPAVLEPGDAVFFHGHVLHRSHANRSATQSAPRVRRPHYCNARSHVPWDDEPLAAGEMANDRHILARGETYLPYARPRFSADACSAAASAASLLRTPAPSGDEARAISAPGGRRERVVAAGRFPQRFDGVGLGATGGERCGAAAASRWARASAVATAGRRADRRSRPATRCSSSAPSAGPAAWRKPRSGVGASASAPATAWTPFAQSSDALQLWDGVEHASASTPAVVERS